MQNVAGFVFFAYLNCKRFCFFCLQKRGSLPHCCSGTKACLQQKMGTKQKIIYREPGLIHGQSSVMSVFNDAVENSNYPFYGAIRQELASAELPTIAKNLDDAASKLRGNSSPCFDIERRSNS